MKIRNVISLIFLMIACGFFILCAILIIDISIAYSSIAGDPSSSGIDMLSIGMGLVFTMISSLVSLCASAISSLLTKNRAMKIAALVVLVLSVVVFASTIFILIC